MIHLVMKFAHIFDEAFISFKTVEIIKEDGSFMSRENSNQNSCSYGMTVKLQCMIAVP